MGRARLGGVLLAAAVSLGCIEEPAPPADPPAPAVEPAEAAKPPAPSVPLREAAGCIARHPLPAPPAPWQRFPAASPKLTDAERSRLEKAVRAEREKERASILRQAELERHYGVLRKREVTPDAGRAAATAAAFVEALQAARHPMEGVFPPDLDGALTWHLEHPAPGHEDLTREGIARLLGWLGDARAEALVKARLAGSPPTERTYSAVRAWPSPAVAEAFAAALERAPPATSEDQESALGAIAALGAPGLPALEQLLRVAGPPVREDAATWLGTRDAAAAGCLLDHLTKDEDRSVRMAAAVVRQARTQRGEQLCPRVELEPLERAMLEAALRKYLEPVWKGSPGGDPEVTALFIDLGPRVAPMLVDLLASEVSVAAGAVPRYPAAELAALDLQKMGEAAVPCVIDGLWVGGRAQLRARKLLETMTGQSLGDRPEAWVEWYRAKKR